MKSNRYVLDLTNAKLPNWFPEWCPRVMPLRKGQYFKDFDVIEEEMPPGWKGKMWMHYRRVGRGFQTDRMVFPIGVDKHRLPKGAVIKEAT